jgi:stearoyl-CoA desaturase (delta-9 desaturase)
MNISSVSDSEAAVLQPQIPPFVGEPAAATATVITPAVKPAKAPFQGIVKEYHVVKSIPFFLIHLSVLGIFFVTFQWRWLALAAVLYVLRMFVVTGGYHRYFSHRSFKLGRFWQFVLAFAAQTSGQKGILWWAANHRHHHKYSDQAEDIHSPIWQGIWWAHVGWIMSKEYEEYDPRMIQDFGKYPELRWLNKYHWVPIITLGAAVWLLGGASAFFWGFILSTVLLYHGTFCINSFSHLWGTRRFDTPDRSRNNFLLALITLGEGWHNNHHKFMYACRQGLRWWEVDFTFYGLKILNWLGIVRDIRPFRLPSETQKDAVA